MRDYALEKTFDLKFTTRAFATGVPTTLAGSPVISAYPGNSTTQLTAGITLTVDFDGVAGLHNVRVVATAANGYATATDYALVITTGTVGGVSVVGEVIGEFSLEAQSPLRPTVAARTLDVSAAGEAGLDWANIGAPTTAQNLSATNIDVDQIVASVSGAVGSVTGAVGSVTGAVGSVASGGIATTSFAAGAINAAAIAADAIGASELAADAVTEIANAVWDTDATGRQTQGTFGQALGDPVADTNTIFKAVVTDATGANVAVDVVAMKVDTAAILVDTAEIGAAGAGLTNIDLPNQAMNITGNITGNLSGSVGSVTGAVGSVTGAVGSIGSGGIAAAAFAAGAIDAAAIAADAIGSSELAASAVTKIRTSILSDVVDGSVVDAGPAAGDFDGVSTLTATDDFYNGSVLSFTSGALKSIARKISDYTGSTRNLAFTGATGAADAPFPSAPANGDTFEILGRIG